MKKNNKKNVQFNRKNKQKQYKNIKGAKRSNKSIISKFFLGFGLIPKILSGFGLIIIVLQGFKFLKEEYLDEPPVSNYSYSNLETISELKRLNSLYDDTGESIYIDRIVEIIAHNFHTLRHQTPGNFNKTFGQIYFLNSAISHTANLALPYMGLVNSKVLSRDDWHDIEFVPRVKEDSRQINLKLQFNSWWENQIILDDHSGNKYTRRSIILNYAFHRLKKKYNNVKDIEVIKKFEFSGLYNHYNPDSGILTIEGVVLRPSKSIEGSISRDKDVLLFENIRGISGEIAETFEASFITNNNSPFSK